MCLGCVTTYMDFNLFELQTSKLKMKFSDVQGKKEEWGGAGYWGNIAALWVRHCEFAQHMHAWTFILKEMPDVGKE